MTDKDNFPFDMIVDLKFDDQVLGSYGSYHMTVETLFQHFKKKLKTQDGHGGVSRPEDDSDSE